MPSESPDLVVRVSLVRDEASFRELDPPVWRTVRVSSSVKLDLLHDKVLVPAMGWTRNYHTYYFRPAPRKGGPAASLLQGRDDGEKEEKEEKTFEEKVVLSDPKFVEREGRLEAMCQGDEYHGSSSYKDCVHYVQTNASAADVMHVRNIVDEDKIRNPEDCEIGELLREVGDRCIYNYDLGDCWYHCLEVLEAIDASQADGKVQLMDGAMRCPDEDGNGCAAYQKEVLNSFLKVRENRTDFVAARKLARACFERRNNLNVLGPFRPGEFSLPERRSALAAALASRNSTMDLVKTFSGGKGFGAARLGQRHVEYRKEDDRADRSGRDVGFMRFHETVNVMPDPKEHSLCYWCGSPHGLKMAISSLYCSRECQTAHWHAGHKKQAKKERLAYTKYCHEKETNTPDPNRFNHDGGFLPIKKYVEGRLRFKVGDYVECLVGEDTYATGRIVKLMYREPSMARAAPYQVKLDRESADRLGVPFQQALIYSDWDDDLKIRRLPERKRPGKKGAAKRGKKGRGKR